MKLTKRHLESANPLFGKSKIKIKIKNQNQIFSSRLVTRHSSSLLVPTLPPSTHSTHTSHTSHTLTTSTHLPPSPPRGMRRIYKVGLIILTFYTLSQLAVFSTTLSPRPSTPSSPPAPPATPAWVPTHLLVPGRQRERRWAIVSVFQWVFGIKDHEESVDERHWGVLPEHLAVVKSHNSLRKTHPQGAYPFWAILSPVCAPGTPPWFPNATLAKEYAHARRILPPPKPQRELQSDTTPLLSAAHGSVPGWMNDFLRAGGEKERRREWRSVEDRMMDRGAPGSREEEEGRACWDAVSPVSPVSPEMGGGDGSNGHNKRRENGGKGVPMPVEDEWSSRWRCTGGSIFNRSCVVENVCIDHSRKWDNKEGLPLVAFVPDAVYEEYVGTPCLRKEGSKYGGNIDQAMTKHLPCATMDPLNLDHNAHVKVYLRPASEAPHPEQDVVWHGDRDQTTLMFDIPQPTYHSHVLWDGLAAVYTLGLYAGLRTQASAPYLDKDRVRLFFAHNSDRYIHTGRQYRGRTISTSATHGWDVLSSHPPLDPASAYARAGKHSASHTCFPALAYGLASKSIWTGDRWCGIPHRQFPDPVHPPECEASLLDGFVTTFSEGYVPESSLEDVNDAAVARRDPEDGTLNVLLVGRKHEREFEDMAGVAAALNQALEPERIHIDTVYFEHLTLKAQVKLMQKTDVMIVHMGSSLGNAMFLPRSSVVISVGSVFIESTSCMFDRIITDLGHYNISYTERRPSHLRSLVVDTDLFETRVRWYAHEASLYAGWFEGHPHAPSLGDFHQYSIVLDTPRLTAAIQQAASLLRRTYPGSPTPAQWAANPVLHWPHAKWTSISDVFDYKGGEGGVTNVPPEPFVASPHHEKWGHSGRMQRPTGLRTGRPPTQ